MAFDLNCPKCSAKLRFDEPPSAGEEIDCPRCETTFRAPPPPPTIGKPAEVPKKPLKKPKAVVGKEREHFSSILLLLIVGSCMAVLIGTLGTIWFFLAKAAKAEDMLATVPDRFNVIRGVNAKAMDNYQKLKSESDKFYDEQAKGLYADACTATNLDPETSLAYFICAREARGGGASGSVLMLFLTKEPFDRFGLGDGEIKPMPGSRVRGKVVCPNDRVIAIAWGGNEDAVLSEVKENANGRPSDGMHTKVGKVGLMAVRGHIWTIIRPTGALTNYFKEDSELIKEDGSLGTLRESYAGAQVLATWTSFGGGGVRFGAGIELDDSDAAKDLVKDMKNGPLGMGDESEPPNATKRLFNFLTQHKEFLQYLEYRSTGETAYIISKISDPEKAKPAMQAFNSSTRGAAGAAGGMGTRFQ